MVKTKTYKEKRTKWDKFLKNKAFTIANNPK